MAKSFLLVLCCLWLDGTFPAHAGDSEDDTDAVKAFKEFLSRPPCVKEVRFTKIQKPPAPQYSYLGGMCGTDFFLRPILPGGNSELPISFTNHAPLGYFVGSHGDKRWLIAALSITEVYYPPQDVTNPYTANVQVGADEMRTVLAMGTHLIEPGSFKWNGNRFVATGTTLLKNLPVDGELIVRNGVVAELVLLAPLPMRLEYAYQQTYSLPPGIPSQFVWTKGADKFIWKYVIEKLELADQIQDTSYFEPYWHVDSKFVGITIITNGSSAVVRDNTRAVLAAHAATRPFTSSPLFFLCLAMLAIGIVVCVWVFVVFRRE